MKDQPIAFDRNSGVTLVETLVALFVIALLASAGAMLTSQSLRGARMVETRGSAASDLSAALATLSSDLGAYTGRASQDAAELEPPASFSGHAPRHDGLLFVFVRNGWTNTSTQPRTDLQRVEYVFERGELIRRSWAAADPGPATPSADQVLLSGISAIEARYGRVDTWRSEWTDTPADPEPAPQKLELKITFAAEDTMTARFLIGAGT